MTLIAIVAELTRSDHDKMEDVLGFSIEDEEATDSRKCYLNPDSIATVIPFLDNDGNEKNKTIIEFKNGSSWIIDIRLSNFISLLDDYGVIIKDSIGYVHNEPK